jgi:hypothetical protein
MAFDDPGSIDFVALFSEAGMFESRSAWGEAGFQVFNRANNGKIMVARHPSVHGLLFKKYGDDVEQKDQLRNFERRVEGASRLRAFVDSRRLSRVVVPRKWIFELPRAVSRRDKSHVLVVEQLDLLGDEQTKAAYERIELDVLRELCTVLFHFRGMDSNGKNLPFTTDGRIAFIDTEHWDRDTSKSYLHHVGEYLSGPRYKAAKRIFDQLEDGKDGRGAPADFADEEDTSGSFDDFADEEDTSSPSSS